MYFFLRHGHCLLFWMLFYQYEAKLLIMQPNLLWNSPDDKPSSQTTTPSRMKRLTRDGVVVVWFYKNVREIRQLCL